MILTSTLLLLLASFFPLSICHDIYVDSHSRTGVSNLSCWTGGESRPCLTLGLGLSGLQQSNHTTLWIMNGPYTLNELSNNTSKNGTLNYHFTGMSNIAIIGVGSNRSQSEVPVTVNCLNSSATGLSFFYTTNITIRGVELFGCAAYHASTSQNFTQFSENLQFAFAYFHVALYFMFCRDVQLDHVAITQSPGTGAVFYSTVGTNIVHNVEFSHNRPAEGYSGGGGLYIEFSYCTPSIDMAYVNCSDGSNVPEEYSRDSNYYIEASLFNSNKAMIVDPEDYTFILPQLSSHLAFGRGGGISVFFKGNATNNTVVVSESCVSHNKALWGAGLFVEYQDLSKNNMFLMENSILDNNQCINSSSEQDGTGGGGARVGYIFFGRTHSKYNRMIFDNVNFTANRAYFGGGLSFYVAREITPTPTNQLEFRQCLWSSNVARVGSGADLSIWHPVTKGAVVKPVFQWCVFTNNSASYTKHLGQFVGVGTLYIDSIPVSFEDDIYFHSNNDTALAALSTGIYVANNTNVRFYNNTGRKGGAIALMGYAFIEVSSGCQFYFVNNSADIKGGAIYGQSIGEHDLISSRTCLIRYFDINATPLDWDANFYFENNNANSKINSIYVTSLLTCLWGGAFGSTQHAAETVFCWNTPGEAPKWIYYSGNCSTDIATSPAAFGVVSNSSSDPDNSPTNMYILNLFPGRRTRLPIVTMDDRKKNVTDNTVLFARVRADSAGSIALDSSSIYISDNALEVHGEPSSFGYIKLETNDPRVISTQVKIELNDCPSGMVTYMSGLLTTCVCNGTSTYSGLIQCYGSEYQAKLNRGAWIGYPDQNSSILLAGQCPYCAEISTSQYFYIPRQPSQLQDQLCGKLNREGVLCGRCKPGFGPAVNSKNFHCVNCTEEDMYRNWFFYMLTDFLPITLFFFVVLFFSVSVTSGPANAFVFFAQMITTALSLDGDGTIRMDDVINNASIAENVLRIIPYDIWNLNFFRPYLPEFCLSPYISTLKLISTGYITAFYPLLLVLIFYSFSWCYGRGYRPIVILLRPFHHCFARLRSIGHFRRSILHALATFILLSYTKFTLVSFILLTATPLIDQTGDPYHYYLYYDGSIEFGSHSHLPYLITSLVVLCTFVALPPIILIWPSVVHLVQKVISRMPDCCGRMQPGANFEQFLDAFHGCYKDGTGGAGNENKYDFRWFSGFYFLLRVVLLAIYAFTSDWFVQCALQQVVCTAALVMFVTLRPYKNDLYNKVDATMFAIIVVLCSLTMYNYYLTLIVQLPLVLTFVLQYILILCPLVYITIFVLYHLWKGNKRFLKKLFKKLFKKTNEREALIQDDDAFLHDTEEAGRFGKDTTEQDRGWTRSRSVRQHPVNESEPLLQNSPRPPSGSRSSGSQRNNSQSSAGKSYGGTTSGTQTPLSGIDNFGIAGFHVEGDELGDEVNISPRKSKRLFFTQ